MRVAYRDEPRARGRHDQLLTLRQAAERMGYTPEYLRRQLDQRSDNLPHFIQLSRSKHWRVWLSEVDRWINDGSRPATGRPPKDLPPPTG